MVTNHIKWAFVIQHNIIVLLIQNPIGQYKMSILCRRINV